MIRADNKRSTKFISTLCISSESEADINSLTNAGDLSDTTRTQSGSEHFLDRNYLTPAAPS